MFDHFPTTHATWIAERVTLSVDPDAAPSLARAARAELNAHVMQRYFAPLCAYVKGSAWRDFGEAADLVNGFFASRLERPEYLLHWRESGLALRRWLINGLLLHLHERAPSVGSIGAVNPWIRSCSTAWARMTRVIRMASVRWTVRGPRRLCKPPFATPCRNSSAPVALKRGLPSGGTSWKACHTTQLRARRATQ